MVMEDLDNEIKKPEKENKVPEKVTKAPDMDALDQGGEKAKNMSFRKSVRYAQFIVFIV